MPNTMNLNVRISGTLKDHVTQEVDGGSYENLSEYIRDLIRQDKARTDEATFQHLKARLQKAFSASDSDYVEISAAEFLARKQAQNRK